MLGLSRVKAVGRYVAVIPLCENMPSGRACKPGDVVVTRAGLSVEVCTIYIPHIITIRGCIIASS